MKILLLTTNASLDRIYPFKRLLDDTIVSDVLFMCPTGRILVSNVNCMQNKTNCHCFLTVRDHKVSQSLLLQQIGEIELFVQRQLLLGVLTNTLVSGGKEIGRNSPISHLNFRYDDF